MELVRRELAGLSEGGPGFLRLYRPEPTAAFSPRDTTLPHYAAAADQMRSRGFVPVERRAGGQLAIYDSGALVIDLVAPHSDPRAQVLERFRLLSAAIARALAGLGVDARIGALDGEYCPGDYSVSGTGRVKLAGLAQRIARGGYHMGAVISVARSDEAKSAVAEAYPMLGLPFDPQTFGSVADLVPDADFSAVRWAVLDAIRSCGALR
jgi:lipoate-protein ligase A